MNRSIPKEEVKNEKVKGKEVKFISRFGEYTEREGERHGIDIRDTWRKCETVGRVAIIAWNGRYTAVIDGTLIALLIVCFRARSTTQRSNTRARVLDQNYSVRCLHIFLRARFCPHIFSCFFRYVFTLKNEKKGKVTFYRRAAKHRECWFTSTRETPFYD